MNLRDQLRRKFALQKNYKTIYLGERNYKASGVVGHDLVVVNNELHLFYNEHNGYRIKKDVFLKSSFPSNYLSTSTSSLIYNQSRGIQIVGNGTKMYIGHANDIKEFDLTTAYDPTTMSYVGRKAIPTDPGGDLKISEDGVHCLYQHGTGDTRTYGVMSTPFDITTFSVISTYSLPSISIMNIFSDDGIYSYTLEKPVDQPFKIVQRFCPNIFRVSGSYILGEAQIPVNQTLDGNFYAMNITQDGRYISLSQYSTNPNSPIRIIELTQPFMITRF